MPFWPATTHHAAVRLASSGPEDLELLRVRLRLLGKVGVAIALPFNVVGVALDLFTGTRKSLLDALVAVDNLVHFAVTLVLVLLLALSSRLPASTLSWLDLAFLPLIDGVFLWAAWHIETTPPVPLATLAFVFAALARAIVVPSSPLRTLVTTLLGCLPTAVGAWYVLEPAGALRLPQTALTALWHLGAVVLSTVTSSVIYGLRHEVSQALRLGQYTLLEKIGAGGMGEVYLARHALLRRPTAVKLLPGGRGSKALIERFEREVQLTSQLTHPNTISVYDYGRTPDGTFYYAMEYLDGLTLQDLVSEDGPQPPARVAKLIYAVCDALNEAHGVGLIHRDVKPANIFVCERGGRADVVKVVDFGLVKAVGSETATLTATDALIGTPLYLSPEGIDQPQAVDARSDLYAVGCVAYFLLTGDPPFLGQSAIEVCLGHLHTAPVPPSLRSGARISAELDALVLDCLAKKPEQRPQSAHAVCERLAALPELAAWTESEARGWWQRRSGSPAKRRQKAEVPSLGVTIGVDIRGRLPGPAAD